jgi:TonB family protein
MNSVEGRVRVRVETDSTGCVIRVDVAQSSGAPELDQAGMLMGFEIQFMPGEVDGKAVGGTFIQPITFGLLDAELRLPTAPPQPQP